MDFLQTLVDSVPVAILVLDEVGTIVFTNLEARELFFDGSKRDGENFLHLLSLVPEKLRMALLSETDHIFSADSAGTPETFHLARREVAIDGVPHVVLVLRNITLEVSRQENAVLKKAIRVIHHEFANSITPVRSLLQSARAKVGQPEWSAKLEQTLAVIEERILHLSAFLTGFASLGRLPLPKPQTVTWQSLLARLEPLLSGVRVGAPPAAPAWLDPVQVEQVLLNLVKNALEAGGPPEEVRLEVVEVPEGGFRTTVFDRGPGMSDQAFEHAMVPSFTTKPTGSGMGLTLCREIVEAHGGRLFIARRDGGGIAVSFWLPPRTATVGATTKNLARLSLTR